MWTRNFWCNYIPVYNTGMITGHNSQATHLRFENYFPNLSVSNECRTQHWPGGTPLGAMEVWRKRQRKKVGGRHFVTLPQKNVREKEKSLDKMQRIQEKGRRDQKWEWRSHIGKIGFQTVACGLLPIALRSWLQKSSSRTIQQPA